MLREHGAILVDGTQVGSTMQCCHCGGHFNYVPGSGTRRGWCTRCSSITCGKAGCVPCIPTEALLEYSEGTKTRYDDLIKQCIAEGAILL